jgi:hypothetical protein
VTAVELARAAAAIAVPAHRGGRAVRLLHPPEISSPPPGRLRFHPRNPVHRW